MSTARQPLWPMGRFAPDPSGLPVIVKPAFNAEPRRPVSIPLILLLHYTGMASGPKAVDWLSGEESRVSCHYVVDTDGTTTQLVPEAYRAWHAGLSYWAGETDLNSASIGIEIQNPGHEDGYADFGPVQMDAVTALARSIVARHGIRREDVLAHSDIAPGRKIDPGEKFPWGMLARDGVGLWIEPTAIDRADLGLGRNESGAVVATVQNNLRAYGFDAPRTGVLDQPTEAIIAAFQRHWRPARVDGRLDQSTRLTLERLIAERQRGQPTIA